VESLRRTIESRGSIRISAYSITEEVERSLRMALQCCLDLFDGAPLANPLYICLKELLINAVKANYKYIFFEGYPGDGAEGSALSYPEALKIFRMELSRSDILYFDVLARRYDIKADVDFRIEKETLIISVSNPVPMTGIESLNVAEKLKEAARCRDLTEYFMKVNEDPNREGAGLGLVIVSMMMAGLGLGGKALSVETRHTHTVSELRIPMEASLVRRYCGS
jgi:hypothetical protein